MNWPVRHDDDADVVKEEAVSHQLSVSQSVTGQSWTDQPLQGESEPHNTNIVY